MRLSIVIPTLNEAGTLEATIALVRDRAKGRGHEIIVADCGSTDDTAVMAERLGVAVEYGPTLTSRARAVNAGGRASTGDVILFLHADSQVPRHYDALIEQTLEEPGVVGGAFEFALDGPEWRLRLVEVVDRVRYRIRGRYYGDQGIFVRRSLFEEAGGFPDEGIFEDAHFCREARRRGRMQLIKAAMRTSPRRFYRGGILTTLAADAWIVIKDLIGLDLSGSARRYRLYNLTMGLDRGDEAAPAPAFSPSALRPIPQTALAAWSRRSNLHVENFLP